MFCFCLLIEALVKYIFLRGRFPLVFELLIYSSMYCFLSVYCHSLLLQFALNTLHVFYSNNFKLKLMPLESALVGAEKKSRGVAFCSRVDASFPL